MIKQTFIKKNRRSILGFVTSFYFFSLYTYIPIFSPYLESLGISYKMMGLIIGSYGFTQMVLRIPLGILSDRLNNRKIFVIAGIVLGFFSALGLGSFEHPYLILFFRSLAGAAAASWVTYTVLFSSYFKSEETPRAIGIINAFLKTGQVVAMLLGGLVAQYISNKAPFLLGTFGAVIGLVLSLFVYEKREVKRKPIKLKQLLLVARNFNLLLVSGLAILFQLIAFATIFGFLPVVAKNIGASDFQLGMLITLSNVPAIIAAAMSGTYFAERYGERYSLVVGFLFIALTTIIAPYIQTLWVLFMTQMIGGFARGLVFSLLMGLSINQISDNKRATAMGFFQAIYGLGMFLGPVLVGILTDFGGLKIGFWFTGIVGIIAAIISRIYLKPNYQIADTIVVDQIENDV